MNIHEQEMNAVALYLHPQFAGNKAERVYALPVGVGSRAF
jgi:hypothetical protein